MCMYGCMYGETPLGYPTYLYSTCLVKKLRGTWLNIPTIDYIECIYTICITIPSPL